MCAANKFYDSDIHPKNCWIAITAVNVSENVVVHYILDFYYTPQELIISFSNLLYVWGKLFILRQKNTVDPND